MNEQQMHEEWLASVLIHEPTNSFDDRLSKLPSATEVAESHDPIAHIKFFFCSLPWRWYVISADRVGDDWRLFCYVTDDHYPDCNEFGDVMLSDLLSLIGPLGASVERDRYWDPRPVSMVKSQEAVSK
jgi:Protein of unknown function (DUF2958)